MTPVTYKGVVVGHMDTDDVCIFNDTEEAREVKMRLNSKQTVGISSRAVGVLDKDGKPESNEPFEYTIIEPLD